MNFDFYEGAAGTGKTHNLVGRAEEIVQIGALSEGQKLLALTFMNGARRRLDARLGQNAVFRRRYDCQTFDVFARMLATRRRSLITAEAREQAVTLGEFDGPCFLAATLLQNETVRQWVARSYPLVMVDEAQDLDEYRLLILQRLSQSCQIVAAADAFQCLRGDCDTTALMSWLNNAGLKHPLTLVRRTQQRGLLAAALAVREARDVKAVLTARTYKGRTTWVGEGFCLFETSATLRNPALLAWSIANDIAQRQGRVAVLTPDANNSIIRSALQTVQSKTYARKNSSVTFGPYPLTWDNNDKEEADVILANIALPDATSLPDLRDLLTPLAGHIAIAQALRRMDRLRRVSGQIIFTNTQVANFVQETILHQSRLGLRQQRGHLAMTIHRAKNREFPNVIVLWPHTATGTPEHLRRLLYNGITRAQNHCTVIVTGQNRVNGAPFCP